MTRDEMLDKREDVLDEFDDRVDPSHGVMTLAETRWFTAQLLADEIMRLRAVLAALREPSEAVVKAVKDAIYEELGIDYWDGKTRRILYYAVAAAEKEVANDAS